MLKVLKIAGLVLGGALFGLVLLGGCVSTSEAELRSVAGTEAPKSSDFEVKKAAKFEIECHPLILSLVNSEELVKRIEACFAFVEGKMGTFANQIHIQIPLGIQVPEDFPKGLVIQGLTFENDGKIIVVVALPYLTDSVITHELCHARLRDLGINPPRWLEEGLAEYFETPDGFREDCAALLACEGGIATENLLKNDKATDEEMKIRASAWAMVYHLVQEKKMTVRQVAELSKNFPKLEDTMLSVFKEGFRRLVEREKAVRQLLGV